MNYDIAFTYIFVCICMHIKLVMLLGLGVGGVLWRLFVSAEREKWMSVDTAIFLCGFK